MSISAALMFLAAGAGQGDPAPVAMNDAAVAPCAYPEMVTADEEAQVLQLVSRFVLAVSCGDLAQARALVHAEGTLAELEEYQGEDGQPVRRINTGAWDEQLALFSGAAAASSTGEHEALRPGEATLLLDGALALVRQPVQSRVTGDPAATECINLHIMLINDGEGWKIRHMMLAANTGECAPQSSAP